MRKATALLIMLVALAGCQRRPSLYGRWELVGLPNSTRGQQPVMVFTDPNQCALLSIISEGKVTVRVLGTFKADGKTITCIFNDMDVIGQGDPADDFRKQLTEKSKRERLDALNKDPITHIEWVNPDKIRAIDKGKPFIFNRLK